MKIRYLVANSIFGSLLLKLAKSQNNNFKGALKILIYHDIAYNDFNKFEEQIEYINRYYGFIRPDDLQDILTGQMKYSGTRVLLTFDDGFKSNVLLAENILNPLGIKAIFFIPPDFINKKSRDAQRIFIAGNIYKNHFSPKEISDDWEPMSWHDLKRLVNQGHTIGAHTLNHRRLTDFKSKDELTREIIESGDMLQKKLGSNIDHFSYPFGDIKSIDLKSMKIIKERYKYCYSGIRGINHFNSNPYAILRDQVSLDDPPAYFRLILENVLALMYKKKAILLANMAKICCL